MTVLPTRQQKANFPNLYTKKPPINRPHSYIQRSTQFSYSCRFRYHHPLPLMTLHQCSGQNLHLSHSHQAPTSLLHVQSMPNSPLEVAKVELQGVVQSPRGVGDVDATLHRALNACPCSWWVAVAWSLLLQVAKTALKCGLRQVSIQVVWRDYFLQLI